MSLRRWAARADKSQSVIVDAIRKSGWAVFVIGRPVDLLCWRRDKGFKCLEVKTDKGKRKERIVIDKRSAEQNEFIELTGTPRVCTPEAALEFLNS